MHTVDLCERRDPQAKIVERMSMHQADRMFRLHCN